MVATVLMLGGGGRRQKELEQLCSQTLSSLAELLLGSGLLLGAIRSIRLAPRSTSVGLLCRPAAAASRSVIERVEPLGADVCVLCALAALYPRLRNGLDAVVGSGDGSCHAGYGVRVPSQGQAVGYCPFQATVAVWKAVVGLEAVEDAEDGRGDRVESCNAVPCDEKQARHTCATITEDQHTLAAQACLTMLLFLNDLIYQ